VLRPTSSAREKWEKYMALSASPESCVPLRLEIEERRNRWIDLGRGWRGGTPLRCLFDPLEGELVVGGAGKGEGRCSMEAENGLTSVKNWNEKLGHEKGRSESRD
jgi:hypothetical protein